MKAELLRRDGPELQGSMRSWEMLVAIMMQRFRELEQRLVICLQRADIRKLTCKLVACEIMHVLARPLCCAALSASRFAICNVADPFDCNICLPDFLKPRQHAQDSKFETVSETIESHREL